MAMTMFLELELLSFKFWISGPKMNYSEKIKTTKMNSGFWSIHVEYPVCKERKHMLNVVFMLPGDSFSNATKEC